MITDIHLRIEINGKEQMGCIALELNQVMNGHHFFRATFYWEDIEKAKNGIGDQALHMIGKRIRLSIFNDVHHEMSFNGIITSVKTLASGNSSQGQRIIFEGYSPTVLLSNGASCQDFTDKNLDDIVNIAGSGTAANLLKLAVSPQYKNTLNYMVQYNESSFAFIDRLARRFGEWFYYDGKELVFGYKKQPVIDLMYGDTLISFDFSMLGTPVHTQYVAHSYVNNDTQTISSSSVQPSATGEAKSVYDHSATLWNIPKANMSNLFDDESALAAQLHTTVQADVNGVAGNTVMFSGHSINPSLFPGAAVKITGGDGYAYGSYTVTAVYHSFNNGGAYFNNFTAIPVSILSSPNTNSSLYPSANTQSGVVTDNNDPSGLGRVKVKLYWQRNTDTPWLRIVMPYAGGGKGMYFVPEKGEEVMVGFEGGNAEKPFIIGALYHGGAKPDGFKNEFNDIKAIRTRSGHTIELNDHDGNESITIIDKNGNNIKIDTKNNELTIVALENIKLSAKNIQIDASESLSFGAGKNISSSAGEKYNVMAKDINEHAENNKIATAKKSETTSEEATINSTSKNLTLASGKSVDVQSNEKVKLF